MDSNTRNIQKWSELFKILLILATRQQLLAWLSTLDYESKHKATRMKRVEGSALWLVNDSRFQAWVSGEASSRMLYCPGLGMPTVSAMLIW
jgi:hypothetical protein